MIKSKAKRMVNAYESYLNSNNCNLDDVYNSYSYEKEQAYKFCLSILRNMNGLRFRIVSHNIYMFTFGFMAVIDDEICFVYVTKTATYYCPIEILDDILN